MTNTVTGTYFEFDVVVHTGRLYGTPEHSLCSAYVDVRVNVGSVTSQVTTWFHLNHNISR